MKKLILLFQIVMLSGTMVLGQVVVPDNWTIDPGIDTYQETADPHGGTSACQVDVQSTNPSQCNLISSTVIPVTAGETYKFKYWYKTSANVKVKGHLMWSNGEQNWVTSNAGEADWTSKARTNVVPAGATSLEIEFRFAAEAGMELGETQFIDDITFESPTGTPLVIENGDMESWPVFEPDPEPTNYPTSFSDTAHVLLIRARWVEDTEGPDFPVGYLIMGAKEGYTAPVPEDGTPVDDDLNWNDGIFAINREFGLNNYDFTDLESSTGYTFTIYPYSNSGEYIDYKTDGAPPTVSATTADADMIESEDFEGETISWATYDVLGVDEWEFPLFNGKTTAKIDGNSGGANHENEDWLISPAIDLSDYNNAFFSFLNMRDLDGPLMKFYASTDYSGSGDPNNANWDDLTSLVDWSEGDYQTITTSDIDLGTYAGGTVYLAFKYTSTDAEAVLYKLDNMQVYSYNPFLRVTSPNGGEEIEQNSTFNIEWEYDFWDGNIDIELIKEGEEPEPIVLNLDVSDSPYAWNVLSSQEPGEDYRVIITSVDNTFPTDTSDAYFTILETESVQADFTTETTNIPEGGSVTFTDMSSGEPDTWEWYFEGGTPETFEGQNPPEIMYETSGSFDVELTVYKGSDQDVMLKEDYIVVGGFPIAGFEASLTEVPVGGTVDFSNLSSGEENTYMWYFDGGEPATSEEENPTGIMYNEAGSFDVTLIASNEFGSDTMTMEGYINAGFAPEANFEASETDILVGDMVDFSNLSTGEVNTYMWSFEGGDPATSDEENPTGITYNAEGNFDVMLITTNSFGSDTLTMEEYIHVGPVGLIEDQEDAFTLFPNPASDRLNIKLPVSGKFEIYVQSIQGKQVVHLSDRSGKVTLNTSDYDPGMYLVTVVDMNGEVIHNSKVVVYH